MDFLYEVEVKLPKDLARNRWYVARTYKIRARNMTHAQDIARSRGRRELKSEVKVARPVSLEVEKARLWMEVLIIEQEKFLDK